MIKKSTLGIDKSVDLGFFGETFINKVYLATYVCILVFIILSILLYKTRFGLRLRACGENPQAADSLGINVYKMRYAGTTISGALAGMGGFVYALTTANCSSNGDVAGFGFLALAVMIFGNWKPLNIAGASLLFGLFKCIAAAYTSLDINGDGVYLLAQIGISAHFYQMLPYLITIIVLAFTSKSSRAPKAEGIPYDKLSRTTVPFRTCRASGRCVPFCKWNAEIPFEAGFAPSSTRAARISGRQQRLLALWPVRRDHPHVFIKIAQTKYTFPVKNAKTYKIHKMVIKLVDIS